MENRLIFVSYKGGNCGDFFSSLLERALGNDDKSYLDDTNRCVYKNSAFIDHGIKGLEEVLRRYYRSGYAESIDKFDHDGLRYLDWTKKIYEFCYDPDENTFIDNLIYYIRSNVVVKNKNTVACIHYYDHVEGLDLSRIYQPSVVFQLMTSDPLHHSCFFYLSKYKQRFNLIKKSADFMEDPPMVNALPGDVTVIDSGKLFLTRDYDDQFESIVSTTLGMDVKIDRDLLNRYRDRNYKILIDAFGEDFLNLSAEEFKRQRIKIFERIRSQ